MPGTLQSARTTLADVVPFAGALGPAATALEPTARKLPSTLANTNTLLQGAALLPLQQLQPFVNASLPVARLLPALAANLKPEIPELIDSFKVLAYSTNELAYNPGHGNPGFLYWLAWFAHNSASFISTSRRQRASVALAVRDQLPVAEGPALRPDPRARARDELQLQLMVTQAPKRAAVLAAVGFTLSCIGLMIFVWTQFGGTVPFAPQGYRVHVMFKETGLLVPGADVRIAGVNVGRVTGGRKPRRELARDDRRLAAVRADPAGHARDPASEDAARRGVCRALLRGAGAARSSRTAARSRSRRSARPSSSTRS